MTNRYRGEFAFPYFDGTGDIEPVQPGDVVLRLRSGDLARLEAELAPMSLTEISKAVIECDARVIFAILKNGLKKRGGNEPWFISKPMLEDLPFALGEIRQTIDDALLWTWTGKTRAELAATMLGADDAKADGGDADDMDGEEAPTGEGRKEAPFDDALTGSPD
jgi:hypothetical protein